MARLHAIKVKGLCACFSYFHRMGHFLHETNFFSVRTSFVLKFRSVVFSQDQWSSKGFPHSMYPFFIRRQGQSLKELMLFQFCNIL